MRSAVALLMPDTAIISELSVTSDGGGGGSISWQVAGTVPARLSPLSASSEADVGERLSTNVQWEIMVPAGTEVSAENRVQIGSQEFDVTGVRAPASWELAVYLDAVETS